MEENSLINLDTEKSELTPVNNKLYYDTLVLSGASIKGFVTLGAVQYAYDNYLLNNLTTYIGTSSGSIICYLLSIGYTPTEIIVYVCTNQVMEKMQNFNIVAMIQNRGACSYNTIQEQLEKMTIAKIGYLPTLNDLKQNYNKNLICVTHNLTEEKTEYLSWETHPNLPCITAIRMSSNLPLIFETFSYNKCMYVDGAISDNFAIDIAAEKGNNILGIILKTDSDSFSKDPDLGILEFIYKLMLVPIEQSVEYKVRKKADKCNVICIEHKNDVKFFDFNINSKVKLEMFSDGYAIMKEKIN